MIEMLKNPLVTTIIGAGVGVLAKSLFDYFKQDKLSREATLRQSRLAFLEKQLSEFYWPLYSRLTRDGAVWKLRSKIDDLDEEQQKAIQKSIETDLLFPNHEAMTEVISNKMYLAGYLDVPELYEGYLRHVAAFRALRATGSTKPPSEMGAPWPYGLTEEVESRTRQLSTEYADLIQLAFKEGRRKPEPTPPT